MAWFVLSTLLISFFTGLSATTDILRPLSLDLSLDIQPVFAETIDLEDNFQGPRKIVAESLGVELRSRSSVLIDTRSGSILFSKGQDKIVPIASITKLVMAMVFLDTDPDWDASVTIIASDLEKEGIPYIGLGETLTVRDAFYTAMVGSANNTALAITRSTGMSEEEFVAKMNSKARQLELFHTNFSDPTGYDQENSSTALDVARMMFHALSYPELKDALTRKEYRFKTAQGFKRYVPATNALLSSYLNEGEYEIVGGKTGYTDEARYTLVVRAIHGDADVIGIVLGSPTIDDRFQDLKSLLAWGFRTFSWE